MPAVWGGRSSGSEGNLPLESELQAWIDTQCSQEQAVALVCIDALHYAKSFQTNLKLLKEFHPGAVQQHNKTASEAKKARMLKFFFYPVHFIAHRSFLATKVRRFDQWLCSEQG